MWTEEDLAMMDEETREGACARHPCSIGSGSSNAARRPQEAGPLRTALGQRPRCCLSRGMGDLKPVLLGADGDLLLIFIDLTVVRDLTTSFEGNYFVYKPHPNPKLASLRLLPQFPEQYFCVRFTSIACRGEDDYVVAGLQPTPVDREVGVLSRFSSSTGRWEHLELPIPFDAEKGLYKFRWESDDMFALDGLMFWVDYHRGMLYCDVFAESPSLRFIQLPGIHIWGANHDYSNGRQLPLAYRRVGASRGQVKFVDIDDGLFGSRKTSGFTITSWSLEMAGLEWIKDTVVEVDDLWSLPEFRSSPLPRWVPEFPVVSKQDPNILHSILRGRQSDAKTWVITLDMRTKALMSYRPFINASNLVFEGFEDVDTSNAFCDIPFVCCDFDCLNTLCS